MDFEAAHAFDARLVGITGAVFALVAAMVATGAISRETVTGALSAYREVAAGMNAGAEGLEEIDKLLRAADAWR